MKKNKLSIDSAAFFSAFFSTFYALAVLAGGIGISSFAQAQENTPITQFPQESEPRETATNSTSANKNKTKIKVDFEDQLITGKHDMPEAEMVFTRTQFNYKKMIRLRDNFIPEVKQGKDEFRGRN